MMLTSKCFYTCIFYQLLVATIFVSMLLLSTVQAGGKDKGDNIIIVGGGAGGGGGGDGHGHGGR